MILLRTLFSMVSATASLLPFSFPRRLATASTMSVFAISSSKPMCSAERDRTRISERPLVFRSAGAVVPAQPARHLLRLHVHRLEVELAVEVHDDYAVAALFALVIMDLSRRLRPHGSRPACLRCCSLESMRELALDHDALIRRGVPVPARVHARRKLLQELRGALVWIPPHREDLQSRVLLGIDGLPRNGVARREGTLGRSGFCDRRRSRARASMLRERLRCFCFHNGSFFLILLSFPLEVSVPTLPSEGLQSPA